MNKYDLSSVASTLFGERWNTALAKELGKNSRTIRFWSSGSRPIPPEIKDELRSMIDKKQSTINDAKLRLDLGVAVNPTSEETKHIIDSSTNKAARCIEHDGRRYVWKSELSTHSEMAEKLKIPYSIQAGMGIILVNT
jgi:hypothetical protein